MDLMKRFGQICHAEKLTYSKANYCTIFKQTIKSIHPDNLTIEKARFSTKRHRIVLALAFCGGPGGPSLSFSKVESVREILFSLRHNLLDQLWIIRQQTRFGQPGRQVKPVAVHGKNLLEQRQALIHATHVGQRHSVPINHFSAVRNK